MNERAFTTNTDVDRLNFMNDGNKEDPISQAYPTGEETNPQLPRRGFLSLVGKSALAAAMISTIPGVSGREDSSKTDDIGEITSQETPASPEVLQGEEKVSSFEPFMKAVNEMTDTQDGGFWQGLTDTLSTVDGRASEDRLVEVIPTLNYKTDFYDKREMAYYQQQGGQNKKAIVNIGIYEPVNTDLSSKPNNAVQSSTVQMYVDLRSFLDSETGDGSFIMDASKKVEIINKFTKPDGLKNLNWSMVDDNMVRQYIDPETGITFSQTLYQDGILSYDLEYPYSDSSNHYFKPQRKDSFPPKPKSV